MKQGYLFFFYDVLIKFIVQKLFRIERFKWFKRSNHFMIGHGIILKKKIFLRKIVKLISLQSLSLIYLTVEELKINS